MSIFKEPDSSAYASEYAIVVDPYGAGHFSSIASAVSYANTLSLGGNRALILVRPGSYTENNTSSAISINSGITIAGEPGAYPVVSVTSNANNLFQSTTSGGVVIAGLTISGPTSAAAIELKSTSSLDRVHDVIITQGQSGVLCSGAVSSVYDIDSVQASACTGAGIKVTAAATTLINNCQTQACGAGVQVTVAGATAFCNGHASIGDTIGFDGNGDATSTIVLVGCSILQATTGIKVNGGCPVYATGSLIQATTDINQADATSIVSLVGCLANPETFTVTGAGLDNYFVDIVDFNTGNKRVKRRAVGTNSTLAKGDDMISLTAAGLTLTLPALAGESSSFPICFWIHNQDSGTQTITANAADTINGSAGGGSYTLAARAGVRLIGFGTTWFVG